MYEVKNLNIASANISLHHFLDGWLIPLGKNPNFTPPSYFVSGIFSVHLQK